MEQIITETAWTQQPLPRKKRVAAYARVSSGKDAMVHSLSAQISYYNNLIQSHANWQYVGVYADEGITGTKQNRPEFQRMLNDCRAGKIDLILAKSISRFARNTVTLLETVRELKSLNIDVFFEEQNMHTCGGDGEFLLTLLASYAQEESLSVSENCKWRIRENFKNGIVSSITMMGYRRNKEGMLEIEPQEADIVRMIFADYLGGMGKQNIANKLNRMQILTRRGHPWHPESVGVLLQNEKYTGDMHLQKTYTSDHISKKKCLNSVEKTSYLVENSHEAIIDRAMFEAAQAERKRRAAHASPKENVSAKPFAGKLICANCGKAYRRKIVHANTKYASVVWICPTYNGGGKAACASKQIPEDVLVEIMKSIMETSNFTAEIQQTVVDGHCLTIQFQDGTTVQTIWENHERGDSWTPEMRKKAGKQSIERSKNTCKQKQSRC